MVEAAGDLREVIEQVRDRVEIEAVIARRVRLQRRGARLVGLCPFHAEKTPSFTVSPDKGFFKCFGCGKSGDVFTFLQELDGLDFMEALRLLAEESGVELPQRQGAARPSSSSLHEEAREALRLARRLYQEALAGPAGAEARRYLEAREVQARSIEAFGLGWSPAEPGWLRSRLLRGGISPEALQEARLVYAPRDGAGARDVFWDRLMFPVSDRSGRTVGFGGRYLPGSRAAQAGAGKYVNSPDGPLFPKRRLLYGLERLARSLQNSPQSGVLLCEGYLDVILLHQAGFGTALGALGTALTEEHARLLRRADRPVILMLDADRAGRAAALRAGRVLVEDGVDVRVVELPDQKDPADMVSAGRIAELQDLVGGARDILDWRLRAWTRLADFALPAVRARAAREIAEWIQATADPALADAWIRRAVDALGIAENNLRRMTDFSAKIGPSAAAPPAAAGGALELLARNEQEVLAALLHDPSLYPRHRSQLEALELQDGLAQRLLNWCRQRRIEGLPFDLASALQEFGEGPDCAPLDEMRRRRLADPGAALEQALAALPGNRERLLRERRRAQAAGGGSPELSDDYLSRYQRKVDVSPFPDRR